MLSRLSNAAILGILTGTIGVIASVLPLGLDLDETVGLDVLFRLRGERPAPPDVVVVSIDKESCECLNLPDNPDKWPRSTHARLTEILAKEGARVIAFDVHFIEPRSPEDDNLFAGAIRAARNVVLCEPLKAREIPLSDRTGPRAEVHSIVKTAKPIPLLSRPAVSTAPFPLPRIPFKVSQYWTFQAGAGDVPTLPVVVFQLFTRQIYGEFVRLLERASPTQARKLPGDCDGAMEAGEINGLIRNIREIFESDPSIAEKMLMELERSRFPSDDGKKVQLITSLINMYRGGNSRYINYCGPPRTITTIPYYQALQLEEGGIGEKRVDLKGKAVFVGLSEVLLAERKDSFYTVFSQANGLFVSGVEIAATAFSNLLENRPLKPLRLHSFILVIFLWGALLAIVCRLLPIVVSVVTVIGLSLLYLVVATYQFKIHDLWFPIVVPLFFQAPLGFFGAVVWNYIETNKERQNIRKAFEHYLPKDVVNQLSKNIATIRTGSKIVYGVCLYTDAEQYTSFSESMDPAELGRFMNRYYETMFKPVKQHGGFISGVIGDSMLALWVAASSENTLRAKACMAALDIRKALEQFDQSSNAVKLRTRIGLHCGPILLGHIGALDHYEYSPMGDIVNTAARIDSLNKKLGASMLVSDEVIHQLGGFLTRELGTFRLAGKVKPVVVHELLGRGEESSEKMRASCVMFAEALSAFRRQSWDEAAEKFHQSLENLGEDGPSHFYLTLCETYKATPPAEPWDGVVRMGEK